VSGAEAAAKKWRGLINIHDLDYTHVPNFWLTCPCRWNINSCRSPPRHQFARVCVRTIPCGPKLNQLRRGHRAWPMFGLKSGAAMAAPAAPMPPPLGVIQMLCVTGCYSNSRQRLWGKESPGQKYISARIVLDTWHSFYKHLSTLSMKMGPNVEQPHNENNINLLLLTFHDILWCHSEMWWTKYACHWLMDVHHSAS